MTILVFRVSTKIGTFTLFYWFVFYFITQTTHFRCSLPAGIIVIILHIDQTLIANWGNDVLGEPISKSPDESESETHKRCILQHVNAEI